MTIISLLFIALMLPVLLSASEAPQRAGLWGRAGCDKGHFWVGKLFFPPAPNSVLFLNVLSGSLEKLDKGKWHLPSRRMGPARCQLGSVAESKGSWETERCDVRNGSSQPSPRVPGVPGHPKGSLMLFPARFCSLARAAFFPVTGVCVNSLLRMWLGSPRPSPLMRNDPWGPVLITNLCGELAVCTVSKTKTPSCPSILGSPGSSCPLLAGIGAAEGNPVISPILQT